MACSEIVTENFLDCRGLEEQNCFIGENMNPQPDEPLASVTPMRTTPVQSKRRKQRLGTLFLAAMSMSLGLKAQAQEQPITTSDLATEMTLVVPMKMRNVSELKARIENHEVISPAEMTEKYFPTESDFQQVRTWFLGQGFSEVQTEGPRLSLFVTGRASQAESSLQVSFVAKQEKGSTYLVPQNEAIVPATIAPLIEGVDGLSTRIQTHSFIDSAPPILGTGNGQSAPLTSAPSGFSPPQIYQAYNGANLPDRGSGQMIAVIADVTPISSDLTTYWNYYGIPQSLNNFQPVVVAGTTGAADTDGTEATLDVEWTSSIASSSVVRFYNCRNFSNANLNLAYQKLVADLPSYPSLHQVSLSFGAVEVATTYDGYGVNKTFATSSSNYLMSMQAYGVTIFVASGDGGSNPSAANKYYDPQNSPAAVTIPSDSQYATAVGGTTLTIGSNGLSTGETAWSVNGEGSYGSGGGASAFFPKPSFQVGTGVPSANHRYTPDVAMDGNPNSGGSVYCSNSTLANGPWYTIGGTSLSTPISAGICACVNQARVAFGLTNFGSSFNQVAYSLLGTSACRDITSGNNGAYAAGGGYDEVTGIGVPNIATLFHASANMFFAYEYDFGNGTYYLSFSTGNPFGYYNYSEFPNIYHVDLGFEGLSTETDANDGVYFYDYMSGHEFYTSPSYPFPYLYDFTLKAVLYYYPQANNPGYYTTNPRYFLNTATNTIFTQ